MQIQVKVAVVLGTRPEIIKMSPVIRALEKANADFFILHSGQHYSYQMDRVFFEQLRLPGVKYNLEIGSGSHATQTARTLVGVESVLIKESPDVVLVEGDTNTVLAGALAASKLHIQVGHVEAGLRSYDRRMPEEVNRVLIDHCSDYLFAPTGNAKTILLGEGLAEESIYVTGNTIVDAVYENLQIASDRASILGRLGLNSRGYFLVTLHRQENVDEPARFSSIVEGFERLATHFNLPVIYPIHPRSRKRMSEFNIELRNLRLIDPTDFLDFLQLEKNARLLLTDSGGVQEESCILGVPCVTLRDNTERPETIHVGSNILAGTSPNTILECAIEMLGRTDSWANPFGDGRAADRILGTILGIA
ncbi:non-hydrolyzing UDP-N-acetylglucosamine 2-epimerase [Chloroflexota bacterium]